jgi:hypothetical protein
MSLGGSRAQLASIYERQTRIVAAAFSAAMETILAMYWKGSSRAAITGLCPLGSYSCVCRNPLNADLVVVKSTEDRA